MNRGLSCCDDVFFYNGKQISLYDVFDCNLKDGDNQVYIYKSENRIVGYLPRFGVVENIATGEKYNLFKRVKNLENCVEPCHFKTKRDLKCVVSANISSEIKFSLNDNEGLSLQRDRFERLILQKEYEIYAEWINNNCEKATVRKRKPSN